MNVYVEKFDVDGAGTDHLPYSSSHRWRVAVAHKNHLLKSVDVYDTEEKALRALVEIQIGMEGLRQLVR